MPIARSLLLLAALSTASFALPAGARESVTGSGHVVTETRNVSGFDRIAVHGALQVVLRQSGKEGVEVKADDNLQPLIETKVVGGTLEVGPKSNSSYSTRNAIEVTVDFVNLRALDVGGAVDVSGKGVKTSALSVMLGGSGDVKLPDLQAASVKIHVGGSGTLKASGKGGKLEIGVGGSGDVDVESFDADDVIVDVGGSGSANVTANKTLKVAIAGSGDVSYRGNPKVSQAIAGSGSLSHR
jgi:hypothetical protein